MSDVMLFRHSYYHPPLDEVEGGGESLTDPTGYIPAEDDKGYAYGRTAAAGCP